MFAMLAVIILAAVSIVAAVLAFKTKVDESLPSYESESARKLRVTYGITSAVTGTIAGVFLVASSVVVISPTEIGVPVAAGTVGEPLNPGIQVKAPWVSVETYPTRPVVVELAGDARVNSRTADAGQLGVEVATRWQVDPARAAELYLQVRTGDDEQISNDLIIKNLRQATNSVYSATGSLVALKDSAATAALIKSELQEQLDKYGVIVEDVNIRSVTPDDRTATVVARKAQQEQETAIATEAKKTAEIEAQRRLIEAQGLKKAATALKGLTPAEASLLCQQTWERANKSAIEAGLVLNTSPCGGSSAGIIVPAK